MNKIRKKIILSALLFAGLGTSVNTWAWSILYEKDLGSLMRAVAIINACEDFLKDARLAKYHVLKSASASAADEEAQFRYRTDVGKDPDSAERILEKRAEEVLMKKVKVVRALKNTQLFVIENLLREKGGVAGSKMLEYFKDKAKSGLNGLCIAISASPDCELEKEEIFWWLRDVDISAYKKIKRRENDLRRGK